MPKGLLIDVLLVNAYVPPRTSDAKANAIRRSLRGSRFMGRLRQALRDLAAQNPPLDVVRLTITR